MQGLLQPIAQKGHVMDVKNKDTMVIPCCFWCQRPKSAPIPIDWLEPLNEADNEEKPALVALDYGPCPTCKKKLESGIALLGGIDKQPDDDRPEIRKGTGVWPTGRYIVAEENTVRAVLGQVLPKEIVENIIKARQGVIADEFLKNWIEAVEAASGSTA